MRSAPAAPGQRCEALVPLFRGPTGEARLGRLLDGPDKGRLVLLRSVAPRDTVGLELTVGVARAITHPSLGKVVGLVKDEAATYVASEHIDGVTVFELLSTIRRDSALQPRIATRILLDALVAADQIDNLLGWRLSPRCVFADTIWIAEYGATLLSEAGVADYVHRADPRGASTGVERGGSRDGGSRADAQTSLELLALLLTGQSLGSPPTPAQAALPRPLSELLQRPSELTHRRQLADALAALPRQLLGTEAEVAKAVGDRFGVTLEMRRFQSTPLEAIADRLADDDETACFAGPMVGMRRGAQRSSDGAQRSSDGAQRSAEPPWPNVSGQRPVLDHHRDPPADPDPDDDDDQETTTAFRPSRIPRLRAQQSPPGLDLTGNDLTQSAVVRTQPRVQSLEPRSSVSSVGLNDLGQPMVALATESDRTPAPQTTTLALSHERADAGGVESRDSITSKPPIMTAKEAALFDMLEQERQQRAGRSLRLLIVVALAVSVGLLLAAFLG